MFSWHATSITSMEIMIQVVLQDPLYISIYPGVLDKLIITINPDALVYMRSLATGVMTENPLRTVSRDFPPQVILGSIIESVEKASIIVKDGGKFSNLANLGA